MSTIGNLADIYGRKWFLLFSVLVSSLSTLAFGLSTSFEMALMWRLVAGVMSSTLAVGKACLADITSAENRAHVFALLGASFALSRSVSSGLGGLLAALNFFGSPYTTVCGFAAVFTGLSALLGAFILPETYPKHVREKMKAQIVCELYYCRRTNLSSLSCLFLFISFDSPSCR